MQSITRLCSQARLVLRHNTQGHFDQSEHTLSETSIGVTCSMFLCSLRSSTRRRIAKTIEKKTCIMGRDIL